MTKKKDEKKKVPTTGQSGPVLELELSDLNPKELRILQFLNQSGPFGDGSGKRADFTIEDIAAACWKHKSKAQGNSWVRNSLRRVTCAGLIEKQDRGVYRVAQKTRNALAKAAEAKDAEPKSEKKAAAESQAA